VSLAAESAELHTLTTTGRGRRWLESGHPWLFENDIASASCAQIDAGAMVAVVDPAGRAIGFGLYSPASKIRVRLVSRAREMPDEGFWRARIERSVALRRELGYDGPQDACRLIGGDSEGLPGFVADRYADTLVLQCGSAGADRLRDLWLALLLEQLPQVKRVLDRSDASVRKLEQLGPRTEWLVGADVGPVEVREGELRYEVDVLAGHKTGHYLDQRENRRLAASFARGKRVLDVFSYDGLFGVHAALSGAAQVLCLDQSAKAGERCLANAARNGVAQRLSFEKVDAMGDLRLRAERGERWDMIVLDPPAFARNKRELPGALRGYRELNRRGMELLAPGGILVSASCSHAMGASEFHDSLRQAAADCGRAAWLMDFRAASLDHPVLLTLPESSYLKCAFVRVE
jgi:23S rRNA (cytosine1962-C5)-methyltransferase